MPVESGPEERQTSGTGPESVPTGTGTGLEPNVAGALCYVLGLITGIAFLALEKERRSVRYHAFQSIGVSVAWIVLAIAGSIIGAIPFVGWIIGGLIGLVLSLGGLILWLYLMWQAYQGNEPELPLVGPWARDQAEGQPPA